MEEEPTPLCANIITKYRKKRQYQRLKGVVTEDYKEDVKISLRQKIRERLRKIQLIPKRLRDAYEEMMICFARHVSHLNNANVYLLKRGSEFQQLRD